MAKEDPIRFDEPESAEQVEEGFDLALLVRKLNQAHSILTVLVHRFECIHDPCFRNDEAAHVWMATQALLELVHSAAANAFEAPDSAFGPDVACILYQCEGLLHLLESERASLDAAPNFSDAVFHGYFQSVMDLLDQALGLINVTQNV